MWNCKTLAPPPYCELKTSLGPRDTGRLLGARNYLKKSETAVHDHLQLLTTELYVTKRIIYKLRNQFRSDKALHTLRQVHACMKRLGAVNLKKQFSEAIQLVDKVGGSTDAEVYLPSRQVLEYQLVLLQGTSALLRQIVQYCLKTFIHVKQHLELGNMIHSNLVMLALVSRLWFVSNSLGLYVCKWYGKLYPCLASLKPTAVTWLQDKLPADLSKWLTALFENIGHSENFCTELGNLAETERQNGALPSNVEFLQRTDGEDLGEPIQRKHGIPESAGFTGVKSVSKQKGSFNKRKSDTDAVISAVKKKPRLFDKNQGKDVTRDVGSPESSESENEEEGENHSKLLEELQDTEDVEQTSVVSGVISGDLGSIEAPMKCVNTMDVQGVKTVNIKNIGCTKRHVKGVTTKGKDSIRAQSEIVTVKDEESIKAQVNAVLNTRKDVENFAKMAKSGTVQIGDTIFKLTKPGSKKIIKNIEKWKSLMKDKGSVTETEKLFVKKVRGPLSELLVRYCQHHTGQEQSDNSVLSGDNLQESNKKKFESFSMGHDSEVDQQRWNKTTDGPNKNKLMDLQHKAKTEKDRMIIEANTASVVNVGHAVKSDNTGLSGIKKKTKKRKKKSRR